MDSVIEELEFETELRCKELLLQQEFFLSLIDAKLNLILCSLPSNIKNMNIKDYKENEKDSKQNEFQYLAKFISSNTSLSEEDKKQAIEKLNQVQRLLHL